MVRIEDQIGGKIGVNQLKIGFEIGGKIGLSKIGYENWILADIFSKISQN